MSRPKTRIIADQYFIFVKKRGRIECDVPIKDTNKRKMVCLFIAPATEYTHHSCFHLKKVLSVILIF